MTDSIFIIDSNESAQIVGEIERALLASLAATNVQATNSSFVLVMRDPDNNLHAGLTASTSYGWMLIKTLWVADELRGLGKGKALVHMAEHEARKIGCQSAWLDTSSDAAHRFYEKLGYQDFGILQNTPDQMPSDHRRWFMKKAL